MSSAYSLGGSGSGSGGSSNGTTITGPLTGFGELETASPSAAAQVAFVYSINPLLLASYTYGVGASITAVNGEAVVASGTATDSYARLFSRRVAKYRPGQGTMARWTARFTTGSTGNRQMAGLYNVEGGYQIGYSGDTFGILYTEAATIEVQTLTISAAPGVGGNVTVTLDAGPGVVVAVTASGNTSITASEIAAGDYSQVAGGWTAQAVANVVYFTRRTAGTAGASTFNPGATGAIGAFAILTTGVAPTETFIPQTSWNQDTMGAGPLNPSGYTLVPTKGNVYGVQFQYLGYGDAFFYVENGTTGRLTLVHIIKNAGARTSTNLRNPNLYLTWESRNTGTATSVTMQGASGGAFVEGTITTLGAQFAVPPVAVTVNAGTETPVLSLRGSQVFQNRQSTAQMQIDRISVAAEGTKPVTFRCYKNGTLTAARWQAVNATTSVASYDTAATAFTLGSGTLVYSFSIAKTGDLVEVLSDLNLFLQAGEYLTLTAQSANNSDIAASFVWVEDV